MKSVPKSVFLACAVVLAVISAAKAESPRDMFIIKQTAKSPDAVVADIKSYSETKKWQYLGESKAKAGEVRLVKLCIPEIGQLLFPVGLELSAMLPCGNVGVYQKNGTTEISVLHPRYMQVLYPHAATEQASAIAQPLFSEMMEAVTQ